MSGFCYPGNLISDNGETGWMDGWFKKKWTDTFLTFLSSSQHFYLFSSAKSKNRLNHTTLGVNHNGINMEVFLSSTSSQVLHSSISTNEPTQYWLASFNKLRLWEKPKQYKQMQLIFGVIFKFFLKTIKKQPLQSVPKRLVCAQQRVLHRFWAGLHRTGTRRITQSASRFTGNVGNSKKKTKWSVARLALRRAGLGR